MIPATSLSKEIICSASQLLALRISIGFAKLNSFIKSFQAVSCSALPSDWYMITGKLPF